MQYAAATEQEISQAQVPHNLFISGLFVFHLLMTPAIIALKVGMAGLLIPLACSATLIGYLYWNSRKSGPWFVVAHWRLAFARSKLLMLGYLITGVLIFLAWLVSLGSHDPNMRHILWTALTRVALTPTVILVLITAVMEFTAYAQAGKREVPDQLAAKFPPPAA